jgi:hypothetical protein
MKLISGTPLVSEVFTIELTMDEVSACAWGLARLASEVPEENKSRIYDLSFQFADLSGDH